MADPLHDDEAGALQIGPTDQGMVRFIIQTHHGVLELDFEPAEAEDIADELIAAAERARGGAPKKRKPAAGSSRGDAPAAGRPRARPPRR